MLTLLGYMLLAAPAADDVDERRAATVAVPENARQETRESCYSGGAREWTAGNEGELPQWRCPSLHKRKTTHYLMLSTGVAI